MSSSTEAGRGHRALQVTVATGVAVALVATAAAATGSRSPEAPTAAQRPAEAQPAVETTDRLTATLPGSASITARFAPRRKEQGAAPDLSAELLPETGPPAGAGTRPKVVGAGIQTGPTFAALGRTGLSVSTSVGAWAPDGSRFAYKSTYAILTVRADRRSPQVIAAKIDANDIAWLPGGFTVGFSARTQGSPGSNLWLAAPNSSGWVQLTRFPKEQGTTAATWIRRDTAVVAYGGSYRTVSRLRTVVRRNGKVTSTPLVPSHPSARMATTHLHDPVASPRLDRIAYRQRDADAASGTGYRDSIWVMKTDGSGARRVGLGSSLGKPVWSADGRTVHALDTTTSGKALMAYPAAGGAAKTLIDNVTAPGVLYRRPLPVGPIRTFRITGRDNVATAVAGSRSGWSVPAAKRSSCANGGAQEAVLIRASSFVEAGPASALAIHKCGPLLITGSARLDARVAAELRRVVPAGRTVHLVGSPQALSPAVEKAVRALKYRTVRYAGVDPYAVSVAVATKGWKDHSSAFLASGRNHTDGIVASVPGGYFGPVLLTDGKKMPKSVIAYIEKYRVGAWAVGAEAHRAAPWATNLSGANGSDTSVAVARNFFDSVGLAVFVNSAAWQDGLTGGTYAAGYGPLLVTPPTTVLGRMRNLLDASSGSLQAAVFFGRPTVPTAAVLRTVVSLGGGRFAL